MKFIIILFVIATTVFAVEQEYFQIPPASLTALHKFALPCAEKYNIDTALIRMLGDPSLPRDDATSNFLLCYAESSGFVDADGHMVVDRIGNVLGNHPKKEEVKEVLRKCNEETKENKLATTIAMHKCYTKNSPLLYSF